MTSALDTFTASVVQRLRSGVRIIYVEANEDARLLRVVRSAARAAGATCWKWTGTTGLTRFNEQDDDWGRSEGLVGDSADALHALAHRPPGRTPEVFVMVDAFGESSHAQVDRVCRVLKDLHLAWAPDEGEPIRTLILSGMGWTLPASLRGYVQLLTLPLPCRIEILDRYRRRPRAQAVLDAERFARRAVGLSDPAIGALVRALEADPPPDHPEAMIDEVKHDEIRRTQVLELTDVPDTIQLGGFFRYRRWFESRKAFFLQSEQPVLRPRGVMLLGFPGTGKTHAARWTARALGVPLVTMDVGRIMDRWVGSSEARMRSALQTLEAVAPAVLFIDEIEKAMAGHGSESTGITTRLVGQLLTWMADRRHPIFTIATCNAARLPPELTRAGRFDASFVVLPPTDAERADILRAVQAELGLMLTAGAFDHAVVHTGPSQSGFTGAELRQLLVEAAYVAGVGNRTLDVAHVKAALGQVTPLVRRADGEAMLSSYRNDILRGLQDAGGEP